MFKLNPNRNFRFRTDIHVRRSSVLTVGRNWLYLNAVNLQGAAGLFFTATINTVTVGAPGCSTSFPTGFVPFTSVYYLSAPNSAGDRLLVGNTLQAGAPDPLVNYKTIQSLPLPAANNQPFCGNVTLATGYSLSAYVPSALERDDNFESSFVGLLIDPVTNTPFPGGIIPASRLYGGLFAWRIPPTAGTLPGNQTETVTVRSGNGSVGGRDGSVTFLLGPASGDLNQPFTASDFQSAQKGPAAFIISPNALWIKSLQEDALATWVSSSSNGAISGNTALYAIPFTIKNPFTSASIAVHYASDDTPSFQGGFFLNGTVFCQDSILLGFSQEHTLNCDIGSLLHVGTNWLYFNITNNAGGTGLLFSATVTAINVTVPSINPGGVVNNASAAVLVSAGSIASVYGSFPVTTPASATGLPSWPLNLGGISIQFGGVQAPLAYVSGGLANLQVPWEIAGQTQVPVVAASGSYTSTPQLANIVPFAPGIFAMNGQGSGQGAILDGSYNLVGASNPVTAGSTVLQIFCTGLGPVTNRPATGSLALSDPLSVTTTTPVVTIGGMSAPVQFSGLTPGGIGLYQVNALVPVGSSTGPSVPVYLGIGGAYSNTVTIAVTQTPNPKPSITSLSPSSATVGSSPLTLTIIGSGFTSSSTVSFNGTTRFPSVVSSSQLTTTLSASDLSKAGTFAVSVTNPPPGGGVSNTLTFAVVPPTSGTTFAVGPKPVALAFDGANVWVANNSGNSVTKVRASDGTVLGTFPAGNSPNAFDIRRSQYLGSQLRNRVCY